VVKQWGEMYRAFNSVAAQSVTLALRSHEATAETVKSVNPLTFNGLLTMLNEALDSTASYK